MARQLKGCAALAEDRDLSTYTGGLTTANNSSTSEFQLASTCVHTHSKR